MPGRNLSFVPYRRGQTAIVVVAANGSFRLHLIMSPRTRKYCTKYSAKGLNPPFINIADILSFYQSVTATVCHAQ